ncbi:MAG: acetylglutamate kinase [Winogradskyella sp.]|uniref:acetylglutamate kinase n=1 Tax=Winogradskyella sp. TaxID=1883156 RepID=UPI000F3D6C4E|nr:acetylglutamate kinase [Winogradskyella sp.]RNC88303.1 MAG: acetylglutamate kinase [Winogradskyella sp.]
MKTLKVIKIGGNIINDDAALRQFLEQFSKLEGLKVLVHGGGKLATELATKIGVEVKMINGRRITDADTLDIITMVYAGKINKTIVAYLQANNCNAIGFAGADGNTIISDKRPVKEVDFGFVGDVKTVNTKTLDIVLNGNIIPVFCAITHDGNGQLLNTNADTIASELAIGLTKNYEVELYYCFEKQGVLKDVNNEDSVIEIISTNTYQSLIEEGVIADGMLPKLDNCMHALKHHVAKVCIGKPEMLFQKNLKFTTIKK